MDITTPLRAMLRRHGQSLTAPRKAVYNALQGQEPLSMHELVARCSEIDRSSVYRTIDLFERLGIVQRLQTGWKYAFELSDQFHEHHHHATCLGCGRAQVLAEDSGLEAQLHTLAARAGFRIERHQLELQGWCADCQAKSDH
jgi:Fe2+ or Zn2+ uptake regulation protein